jgi:DNA polymerase-3 subunit delta'
MSWQRVRGHEAIVQAFQRVVERDRLAHAYLFTGPPGVGKRLFALELARALLCEARPPGKLEACDRCSACLQAAAGTHPDLFLTGRPEESHDLPIDTVRELCRGLALKSARGRGKVAIVDDADDLNAAAANCFLKTLEEPPPQSVLLLIGTSPDLQLSTIVSRCQVIPFRPLPEHVVAELLPTLGVEDPVLVERLARMSGGSLGLAQALADPALWEFRRTFLRGLTRFPLDTVALAKAWTQFVEDAGKESAPQRRRAGLVVRLLIDFLNAALTLSVGGTPCLAEEDDRRALEELTRRLGPDELLAVVDRCLEAERHIDRRVQLVLVLESLVDALGQSFKAAAIA